MYSLPQLQGEGSHELVYDLTMHARQELFLSSCYLSELHTGPCLLWNKICSAVPQLTLEVLHDISEHPDC